MTVRTRDEDDSAVEQATDDSEDGERRATREEGYLDDIEDGCGCAEVWEHLSERRAADSD